MSVVLYCPVCDGQTYITFPTQLFCLFEFEIVRTLPYSFPRQDIFWFFDMQKTKRKTSQLFMASVVGSMQ